MEKQILKVSHDQWKKAQAWERKFWINTEKARARWGKNHLYRILSLFKIKSKFRGNDSNDWWAKQFEDYCFLPDHLDNAAEFGCGPYTNLRMILKRTQCTSVVLSDPLIHTYKDFPLAFINYMAKQDFCTLDDKPLEAVTYDDNTFDLTVLINVLDHVEDAVLCLENAVRVLKKGGYFIFGQELSDEADISRGEHSPGAIGHPVKLNHHAVDSVIDDKFSIIKKEVLSREEGRCPANHYGTYLFAGQKL